MSLAASAKRLARERSSSENFLKALQQAESGTKETPARNDSGIHKSIFGRIPRMFNPLAGSIIYPHLD